MWLGLEDPAAVGGDERAETAEGEVAAMVMAASLLGTVVVFFFFLFFELTGFDRLTVAG